MDASVKQETEKYTKRFMFDENQVSVFDQDDSSSSSTSIIRTISPSSSSSSSTEGEYPDNTVMLKFINDVLMEEDLEGKTCMLQDCLGALQDQERSFYDVLGQEYPYSDNPLSSLNENAQLVHDQFGLDYVRSFLIDSPQSILTGSHFRDNFEKDRDGGFQATSQSRGRKNYERDGNDDFEEEKSSNKQPALSIYEQEPFEQLDKVLLCGHPNNATCSAPEQDNIVEQQKVTRKTSKKKPGSSVSNKTAGEVIDIPYLLTQCAQAVGSNDHRTSRDLLFQIRKHASLYGDGNQRLAHFFANALEVRLVGVCAPIRYTTMLGNNTPMTDALKAYQVYVKACPFRRMSNFFANRTIVKMAKKATSLHIIDFGILYGFQWPCLIHRLSKFPGGAPKLRITGIDLPQAGFKPAARVEETGQRLKRYCERFGVEFEYKAIAQKWETIKYEDLNIDNNELTIVNCLYRFKNLPDDTGVLNSPRDAVLNLIHKVMPDLFIHGVVNGNYNTPFFITRFREALFHFSAMFDMFDATIPREDEQRRVYENGMFGREIMNVIACEGIERVERPESYRQWQVRNLRAGFGQIELDRDTLKRVKDTMRAEYDKEFGVSQDGQWMLQGWKGRVITALSVWKPV